MFIRTFVAALSLLSLVGCTLIGEGDDSSAANSCDDGVAGLRGTDAEAGDLAEADCVADGGDHCTAADFLSSEEAYCMTGFQGEDWHGYLWYHPEYQVPAWSFTWIGSDGDTAYSAVVDAVTGELLEKDRERGGGCRSSDVETDC